jgi:hypothetical protein
VLNRSHFDRGIWCTGIAVGLAAGALGACGLAGSVPGSPGGSAANGGSATTSSAGPSSSTGRPLGGGGSGGFGGDSPDGGSAGSGGASAQGGAGSTTSGSGGATASSSSTGPVSSCADDYMMAPGFQLCVETQTYCDFNVNNGGTQSCGDICTALGGGCIRAFDNGGPCDLFSDADVACNDSHYSTTLCRCTHF